MQDLEQDTSSQSSDSRVSESSHVNHFEQRAHVTEQESDTKKE